ncbi:hypothetical protein [Saccharopolyspora phatthalungensis]|uniref:Uncharacterized protein n=1 Tax=Saccharopolyspora phatthalungensis TaxID=664693 RepID=A0A840QF84_9PSEU|nr:hypothetical protein [Saccharopolyspora phatthalungensis]MBB5159086.1 hypothetical protein [Saccharopolyspora phatthalungensis]
MQDGIFIAAPQGHPWEVSLDQVEGWLRERFPQALIFRERTRSSRVEYLDFECAIEGETRHGAFFERSHLLLNDGSPSFWADFIVWFLGRLPTGSQAVGMLEAVPEPRPLPTDATPDQVIAFFDDLAASDN